MIFALDHLSKGPFSKYLHDLVSVCYMVSYLYPIITFVVVKYGIALVLSILGVILPILFLFGVKSLNSFLVDIFQYLKLLFSSV